MAIWDYKCNNNLHKFLWLNKLFLDYLKHLFKIKKINEIWNYNKITKIVIFVKIFNFVYNLILKYP